MTQPVGTSRDGIVAGASLALFAFGALIALSHHPVAHNSTELASLAAQGRLVHGAIITLVVMLIMALATLSARLGWQRGFVRSAFVAFALGGGAGIGAMLIDGFIVADIAEHFAAPTDAAAIRPIITVAGYAIQVLTKLYLLLGSAGIALWSLDLAHRKGAARYAGFLGIIVGIACSAAVIGLDLRLNPHSLMPLMGAHSLWFLAISALLLTKRV